MLCYIGFGRIRYLSEYNDAQIYVQDDETKPYLSSTEANWSSVGVDAPSTWYVVVCVHAPWKSIVMSTRTVMNVPSNNIIVMEMLRLKVTSIL